MTQEHFLDVVKTFTHFTLMIDQERDEMVLPFQELTEQQQVLALNRSVLGSLLCLGDGLEQNFRSFVVSYPLTFIFHVFL
jgi:hypothetical protein